MVGGFIALGITAGIGVGSLAALAGNPAPLLLLAFPVVLRAIGTVTERAEMRDRVVWVWPLVALPVAGATFYVLPPDRAPIVLGLVVVAWFILGLGSGVLEVVLDRDGRLAANSE